MEACEVKELFGRTEHTRINMSHFSYSCKMRYPLNLVLENCEYLLQTLGFLSNALSFLVKIPNQFTQFHKK